METAQIGGGAKNLWGEQQSAGKLHDPTSPTKGS